MTIEEWAKDFKSYVNALNMPRDDYNGIMEYIDDAITILKEQETTLEKDGHRIRCLNCGEYWCDNDKEGNPFPMNFCPNCGKVVKWR